MLKCYLVITNSGQYPTAFLSRSDAAASFTVLIIRVRVMQVRGV